MKKGLRAGISKVKHIIVDREHTISLMGGKEGRIYGRPGLARDLEHACRDILLEHADPGEDSVGMEITVRHTAPTLPGMAVDTTAMVAAVEGRKVTFDLHAVRCRRHQNLRAAESESGVRRRASCQIG